jgi:hypothetical protein
MFWNCRGLEYELIIIEGLHANEDSFKLFDADLSCPRWIWIPGPARLLKVPKWKKLYMRNLIKTLSKKSVRKSVLTKLDFGG